MRGELGDFLADADADAGAVVGGATALGAIGLPWIEMAPDGAWRRRPNG